MIESRSLQELRRRFSTLLSDHLPEVQIVLGSGFGLALDGLMDGSAIWQEIGKIGFEEIPGLHSSTTPDHAGNYRWVRHRPSGKSVLFQCGRLHGYEGHAPADAIGPVMLGRMLGIEKFLLTNAAGGISPDHRLGDVMLIRDHINFTGQNPLVGKNPSHPDGRPLGPRFPDLSGTYDSETAGKLRNVLQGCGARVHDGVYLGVLGPSFETPAEITLFAKWGAQAVGMSTVWEAIALKHSGARVSGLSLISNAAAGLGDGLPLEHEKILETCRVSAARIMSGIFAWLEGEFGGRLS